MVKKAEKIWFDGEFVNWDEANVHVLSHTLHYGLGIFEGIRAYERADGRTHIFRLEEHIHRMVSGARMFNLKLQFTEEEICKACKETLRINNQKESYLRPLVFIGSGVMGVAAKGNPIHTVIATWPWGEYLGEGALENGIRGKISSFARNHPNSVLVKGKVTGHYVNSILAKHEALAGGYDEAILLDHEGYISEASGENIFIIKNGIVKTPPYSSSILGGITRDAVITLCKEMNIPIEFGRFARDELYMADEVFFSGTAVEITPVREIDDREIGKGGRGEITHRLQNRFFEIVRGTDNSHPEWLSFI